MANFPTTGLIEFASGKREDGFSQPIIEALPNFEYPGTLAMRLLGWIKDWARAGERPLSRDPFRPVPSAMAQFIQAIPRAGEYVVVVDEHLEFAPTLSDAARRELVAEVAANYKPRAHFFPLGSSERLTRRPNNSEGKASGQTP